MTRNRIPVFLALAMFCAGAVTALAQNAPIPKHLEFGRTLLAELAPENNSYEHWDWVKWKGDFLVSRYEAHTDCSGLINSLLQRAHSPSLARLTTVAQRARPRAKDYYLLISRQDSFRRIDDIRDVLPGDIIAVKYLNRSGLKDGTGHVMLVDAKPVLRNKDTKPIVEGTKQWEVVVIDSSEGPHGKGDTRQKEDGAKGNGVGRGVLRLYANEESRLLGYSFSTAGASTFYGNSTRPIAIGRPLQKAVNK